MVSTNSRTARRSQKQMVEDLGRIQLAAKHATSMKEICDMTGLTMNQIDASLAGHPIITNRVKKCLSENKEQDVKEEKEVVKKYVIDASIVGTEDIIQKINEICGQENTIVLTSVTIKELEKLQKINDDAGWNAKRILALAAKDSKESHFETILIDETFGIPDDQIVKYCADNKNSVKLLTCDKAMSLKARMYGVEAIYFEHSRKKQSDVMTKTTNPVVKRIMTLTPAKLIDGKLVIDNFQSEKMSIRVYSDGLEFNDGTIKLHIGDDVFLSSRKDNYVTFAHYRIIALKEKDNCELIYSGRFYDYFNTIRVNNPAYKKFINEFRYRHDIS